MPAQIVLLSSLTVVAYTYDEEVGEISRKVRLRRGENYFLGEFSEVDGAETIVELLGVGVVVLPSEAWARLEKIRFLFDPDNPSLN